MFNLIWDLRKYSGYLKHVGQARVAYFTDLRAGPDQSVRCEGAFIAIPHIHPGYDSKSTQCVSQRRLYLLTNILTWVYIDTAIEKVMSNQVDLNNRQKLCEVMMSSADARLTESGFWRAFGGAKTELKLVWRLLRGDDLHVNKIPKVLSPSRSKNRSKGRDKEPEQTPVFPQGQFDSSFIFVSLDAIRDGKLEDDSIFSKTPSDNAAQDHLIREAENTNGNENTEFTTASKALLADQEFANGTSCTFTDATGTIPTYTPTANVAWLSEENFDDELDDSVPEVQVGPSQSSSSKFKSRKKSSDENTTLIKSSSKQSKPSKGKVTKSSEDIGQGFHFVNVFQSMLADNAQSVPNDTLVSDLGWVEEEGIDSLIGFDQGLVNEWRPDSDLHASYLRKFVTDLEQTGTTAGQPHSQERVHQAKYLWDARIGGLHEILARVDQNWVPWETFLLEQPKDYWILACFVAMESFDDMCPGKRDILLSYRPKGTTDDWHHNFLQRRKAFRAACNDYSQRQKNWDESRQKRREYKTTVKSVADLDGSEVDINKQQFMTIVCKDHDGKERRIWMTVPRSA